MNFLPLSAEEAGVDNRLGILLGFQKNLKSLEKWGLEGGERNVRTM